MRIMIQEDKKLLLQDFSARLSHGVIVSTPKGNGHLCTINQTIFGNEYLVNNSRHSFVYSSSRLIILYNGFSNILFVNIIGE